MVCRLDGAGGEGSPGDHAGDRPLTAAGGVGGAGGLPAATAFPSRRPEAAASSGKAGSSPWNMSAGESYAEVLARREGERLEPQDVMDKLLRSPGTSPAARQAASCPSLVSCCSPLAAAGATTSRA